MDEVTIVKNAVADAEWEEKIRRCQESGLTVQEWCNRNNVNIKTYYYHLRRTRNKNSNRRGGNKNPRRNVGKNNNCCFEDFEMLNEFAENKTVYIVTGYTDMRKGIDGLAAIIQGKLQLDPYSQALFLFCGRSTNKMKGLLWDGDGFLLLYKCLDNVSSR